jgi:hypothetical protein
MVEFKPGAAIQSLGAVGGVAGASNCDCARRHFIKSMNLQPLPCAIRPIGSTLLSCVDVANTALVSTAMQTCAPIPRVFLRLTVRLSPQESRNEVSGRFVPERRSLWRVSPQMSLN